MAEGDVTRRTAVGTALGTALTGVLATSGAHAAAAPRRIVSLNPCLDTMLVHLADRAQIAALSHYAREPSGSTIAAIARTLPFTYETAEEVLALSPDLVLASRHSGPATRAALDRIGVPVVTFGVPDTVAESQAQIVEMARAIGQPARGAALAARIEAALAQAAPPPQARPVRALVFQSRGMVAGAGTLIDELMRRTGFENVAHRYGVANWGTAPLERLLADPPEVLLCGEAAPGAPTWSQRLLSHPALDRVGDRMHRATFPAACLYCAGPVLLKTAPLLASARDAYLGAA
ncbi:MAG: helical backbone metal receptor [Hyphomonadaceae bacterium]|nr:helical backbone metal receptor [Hyphomonadaceae bacterium]